MMMCIFLIMLGCIIQARMGSTRLPGKVMKLLDGNNPSISSTISQLKQCTEIDKIIVATTTNQEDNVIADYVENLGIDLFRGSADDVLGRYYECARKYSLSGILRVTADCPLIDPTIVDTGLKIFKNGNYDYVTNTLNRTFPDGNETEIFSFKSLEYAYNDANLPSEREHVTPYIHKNDALFKIGKVRNNTDYSQIRLTVDRELDLELVRKIISKINKKPILLEDILNLFKKEPELFQLNQEYTTDEGYLKSLKEDNDFIKDKSL